MNNERVEAIEQETIELKQRLQDLYTKKKNICEAEAYLRNLEKMELKLDLNYTLEILRATYIELKNNKIISLHINQNICEKIKLHLSEYKKELSGKKALGEQYKFYSIITSEELYSVGKTNFIKALLDIWFEIIDNEKEKFKKITKFKRIVTATFNCTTEPDENGKYSLNKYIVEDIFEPFAREILAELEKERITIEMFSSQIVEEIRLKIYEKEKIVGGRYENRRKIKDLVAAVVVGVLVSVAGNVISTRINSQVFDAQRQKEAEVKIKEIKTSENDKKGAKKVEGKKKNVKG